MSRELVLSVSVRDCEVQTFRAGGKGGQHQNKTDSGVRVIHHPSGARGESREERSQHANKRKAFLRMIDTPQFKFWMDVELKHRKSDEELLAEVEKDLATPGHVKTEVKLNGKWTEQEAGE